MPVQNLCRLILVSAACCLMSCSGQRPELQIERVEVVPVQGSVKIDGNPEPDVIIRCVPNDKFEHTSLANSLGGRTDAKGNFTLGTYEIADGVPPGEYALTFLWPPVTLKRQSHADAEKHDRLKGKYLNVEQSVLKLTVEKGKPIILETVDLQTK